MDKPVRIFPLLYNISDFLNQEHPKLHPDSTKYIEYWEDQEKKCIEGIWGLDKEGENGGWRYMPGFLYYYVNICKIIDEGDDGRPTIEKNPDLRDIEWVLSYGWLAAKKFSGFMEDEEFTCNRLVKKVEDGEELEPKEKLRLDKAKYVRKPNGEFKKYRDAIEYLYSTHEKPLGLPCYENEAKNLFVLSARGFGKSFFAANAVIGHEFNFDGIRYFSEVTSGDAATEIFVGAALSDKSSDLLNKFQLTQRYLQKEIGAWNDNFDLIPGYFYRNTLGTLQPNNGKNPYRFMYKQKIKGQWNFEGTGTKIYHGIFTTENPQAAVGTRPSIMVIEEVGLLSNLTDVHGSNETCLIRKTKFGSALYIGTSGNIEKITESKLIFENADAYDFISYKDEFENRRNRIGLFIPGYYVDSDFKDPKTGNTDIEAAFAQEMFNRKAKTTEGGTAALDNYIMARPIKPSEMFLQANTNIFPIAWLRDRLNEIEMNKIFETVATVGTLEFIDGNKGDVRFVPDLQKSLKPIVTLDVEHMKRNLEGAVIIYEFPPETLPPAKYRNNLYKVVCDPVKDDKGGPSFYSVLVYKGWPDKDFDGGLKNAIVAEYFGRLSDVEEMHLIAYKLAKFYNAKLLPEVDIPDIIRYIRKTVKDPFVLQWNPSTAVSKILKNPTFKYDVGLNMKSRELKVQAAWLAKKWLERPISKDEDGNVLARGLDNIYSPRLLYELINYDYDGNFDHVSSFLVLMLWLSDEVEVPVKKEDQDSDRVKEINNFFSRRKMSSNLKLNTDVISL